MAYLLTHGMIPTTGKTALTFFQWLRFPLSSAAKDVLRRASKIIMEKDCQRTLNHTSETEVPLIARFPTEILILIFEHGHEGRFTTFSHIVGSVCRHWRRLALATPSLWSPITFTEDGGPNYLHRARLYLERSKASPVDITVNCGMGNLLETFSTDLLPHLFHCRSLSVEGDGGSFYRDLERLGSMETPMLESLELTNTFPHLHSTLRTWTSPPPRPLFSSANLHTVHMDMIHLRGLDITRFFQLENVTNFSFRWELLAGDHVDGGPEEMTVDMHVPQIIGTMPKLRELTLTCWDTASNVSLVPLLDKLPTSLVFLALNGISLAWDLKYGNWQRHDFSLLQTIKLSFSCAVEPVDTELFMLLRLAPDLKELYIGAVDLLPHPTDSVQPLCLSRLKILSLDWVGKHSLEVFLQNLATPALTKAAFIVSHHHKVEQNVYDDNSEAIIPAFWRSCPDVESIILSHGCTLPRNKDLLVALRDVLRNVRSLGLRGHSRWDNGLLMGLGTAPWPCPALEMLSFGYMPDLTQDALECCLRERKQGFLAGECAAIKKVSMRGCNQLRDTETLRAIVKEVWHYI